MEIVIETNAGKYYASGNRRARVLFKTLCGSEDEIIESVTGRYYKKSLVNRQRGSRNRNGVIPRYEFRLVTKFYHEYYQ